jgi:hypothetical protein
MTFKSLIETLVAADIDSLERKVSAPAMCCSRHPVTNRAEPRPQIDSSLFCCQKPEA